MTSIKDLMEIKSWTHFYNWAHNPFTIKVNIPSQFFVTQQDTISTIIDHIKNNGIINVIGSPGMGKTELAMQLFSQIRDHYNVAYIDLSGMEMNIKVFNEKILEQIPPGFLLKRRIKKTKNTDLIIQHLNKTRKHNNHILLMIDEAQNISDTVVIDAMRKISDNCNNTTLLLFSLQNLSDIQPFRESLRRRIKVVQMRGVDITEANELIEKRIKFAGGDGIHPFTNDIIDFLWRISGKVPGVILQQCEELCRQNASEGKNEKIMLETALLVLKEKRMPPAEKPELVKEEPLYVKKVKKIEPETPAPKVPDTLQAKQILSALSNQQQEILLLAKDLPMFTMRELSSKLGAEYFSVSTQIRRINKKIGGEVFVLIRKEGKNKFWKLGDNYKILFSRT